MLRSASSEQRNHVQLRNAMCSVRALVFFLCFIPIIVIIILETCVWFDVLHYIIFLSSNFDLWVNGSLVHCIIYQLQWLDFHSSKVDLVIIWFWFFCVWIFYSSRLNVSQLLCAIVWEVQFHVTYNSYFISTLYIFCSFDMIFLWLLIYWVSSFFSSIDIWSMSECLVHVDHTSDC